MKVQTRAGSKIHIFKVLSNGLGLIGAYDDGTGNLIPCRWFDQGKYLKTGEPCSLDIVYGEEKKPAAA